MEEDGRASTPDRQQERHPGWPAYAELHCLSNFSFLRGASHPEELVERAAELGYSALAITDRNSLAGIVRAHLAAKEHKLHLIIGAEITPVDAPPIVLLSPDRPAYGRLARLITRGRLRARKGECEIRLADIAELASGLIGIALPQLDPETPATAPPAGPPHKPGPRLHLGLRSALASYQDIFGSDLYLAAELTADMPDDLWLEQLATLSKETGIRLVAANAVHYHLPRRRYLQDVLTCIRRKCTLHEAGSRLFANAERYLRPRNEIQRRYRLYPELIDRTVDIARRCTFSLDELRYEYPHELVPDGKTPHAYLRELTWAGAAQRYPDGIPDRVRQQIEKELQLIAELKYEHYFLTVWDLVRFARSRGILCQGRGSAANSAVCYCLGITAVDPARIDLLFERFVSRERNEPPDIDVDFEHQRREEVFQYIYQKYGRERAAITAEVITYCPRSAVRDVGKALGLSLDRVDVLAKALDFWSDEPVPEEALRAAGLDPDDRMVQMLIRLTKELLGFPRHLSQHVGGFVITETPLCEIVPLQNGAMPGRTFIEWDKDDIDALGLLKVDCLALGMLTAITRCFALLRSSPAQQAPGSHNLVPESLHDIPPEDPAVYDMICAADTVGVFQIESRAQMSMLPRLQPRCFYDLVIEVAIVRPGPIQGGMIHPYLRRRNGLEPVTYPSPAIRAVLEKTLGVPLFQEQVMRLAVVAASFTPGEADQLRRSMAAWRRGGQLEKFQIRLLRGMLANGYSREFAEQIYKQIRGFGEYGFPESHAASFALLVYASAWLKRYYPAAFTAALLNSQPMGFYAPAQLVRDALRHGVTVLPVDVNASGWDCTLEPGNREGRTGNGEQETGSRDWRSPAGGQFGKQNGVPGTRDNNDIGLSASGNPVEGSRTDQGDLHDHAAHAKSRALWTDRADLSGRHLDTDQYRPGQCAPATPRLHTFSDTDTRIAGETGYPTDHCQGARHDRAKQARAGPNGRGRPPATGIDQQPTPARLLNAAPCSPVPVPCLRLGFRLVRGLSEEKVRGILAARRKGPIRSIQQLARRPDVTRETLLRLAAADAFRSLGLNRRQALWEILALDDADQPLFVNLQADEASPQLPTMSLEETVVQDYNALGLSLNAHPIELVREDLQELHVSTSQQLRNAGHGQRLAVAGLVTHRQRPGTAKGMVFMTLEDETGQANLIIRPTVWERYKAVGRSKIALIAEGRVERQGQVVNLQVQRLRDLSGCISAVNAKSRDFH